jgi:hypothetical protein
VENNLTQRVDKNIAAIMLAFGWIDMKRLLKWLVAISFSFTVVACAGKVKVDEHTLDEILSEVGYRPGESVDTISPYSVSYWTYIDNRHLIFSNENGEHYLLSFESDCSRQADVKTLTFKVREDVLSPFDSVVLASGSCEIDTLSRVYLSE